MEHAKKMALVEPRLLESLQWQQQEFQTPMSKAMSTLDSDMQGILSRHDVPPDEKVKLYNQTLQRFINYHDQRQMAAKAPVQVAMVDSGTTSPSADTSPVMADAIEKELLESVPPRMKKKAQLLINRMKAHPQLSWSDRGELVYKDQIVPDTNVADLVNDMLRRRKHFEPHGWQTFARALKETNVPQDLIGHQERWQWMQRPGQEPSSTPSRSRRKTSRVVSTRVPRWSSY